VAAVKGLKNVFKKVAQGIDLARLFLFMYTALNFF